MMFLLKRSWLGAWVFCLSAGLMLLAGGDARAQWQEGDVSMTIEDSPDPVEAGATVTYQITLTNAGEPTGLWYLDGWTDVPLEITSVTSGTEAICGTYGSGFSCWFESEFILGTGESVSWEVVANVLPTIPFDFDFYVSAGHYWGYVYDIETTHLVPNPDIDGDGFLNEMDNCPYVANPLQEDYDGDGEGDACDADDDNDGVYDDWDPSPFDRFACGDFDGDTCDDCSILGYNDPSNDGADDDGDGVCNSGDNCVSLSNPDQRDQDGDRFGDVCDLCANTDLGGPIPTAYLEDGHMGDDRTIYGCNASQILSCKPGDNDGEIEHGLSPGTQDLFKLERGWGKDTDRDGVRDCFDNCRRIANPQQEDLDGDRLGDACDPDDDGDGVKDAADNCPAAYNPDQADADGDGTGDACERCAPEASYALSFSAPPRVIGSAGSKVLAEVKSVLWISPGAEDVQGWSISLGTEGCRIVAATTDATDVPEDVMFEVAQLAINAADLGLDSGAVSAVVLPFFPIVMWGAEGSPYKILTVTIEADVPEGAGCTECLLRYADGLRGLGEPVPNIVSVYPGYSRYPAFCESTILVCGQ